MKGIILTNGIGRSEKSDNPEKMAKRLGLPYEVFNWQEIVEPESDELTELHASYGSTFSKKARKLIYEYLYDETSYCKHKGAIQKKLYNLIRKSGFTEVILIGHSWGGVIMYDYAKDIGGVKKLITTGCPLPLNRGLDIKMVDAEWYNYWEKNDPIAHKIFRIPCMNYEFKSSNWLRSWNFSVHSNYFGSRKLSKIIREIL